MHAPPADEGLYSAELCCNWIRWEPMPEDTLRLRVQDLESTDMTGAIRVAQMLHPDVRRVMVWSGSRLDVVYRLEGSGWVAQEP